MNDPDRLQPADIGAVAWTHPSFLCNGYVNLGLTSIGRLMTFAFRCPVHQTVSRIWSCGAAGAGLANCYLGIYAVSGNGGSLIGQTGDLSASWAATGAYGSALNKPVDLLSSQVYRIGMLLGAGTAVFQPYGTSGGAAGTPDRVNLGTTDPSQYAAAIGPVGQGLTALPAWFDHSVMLQGPGFPSFVMTAT
jgi:hypothetical protein